MDLAILGTGSFLSSSENFFMIFPSMLKYNNDFYHLLQSLLHFLYSLLLKNFRFVTGFLKFIFYSLLFQIETAYCGVFLEI